MPRILSQLTVVAIAGTCSLYSRSAKGTIGYAVFQEGPYGPEQLSDWVDDRDQAMHELRLFFRARRPASRMVEYREPRCEEAPSLTALVDFYVGVPEDEDGYDNHEPW